MNADLLQHLDALGVAIFTAPPAGKDYDRAKGWQNLTADGNADRLSRYVVGHAVMAGLGRVAVVDVDTKNGASIEATRAWLDGIAVRVYAEVETPSGGRHFYVAGHPDLPTVHATEGRDGLTGLPGVEVLSHGANVFLPGTARAKYDGRGYAVLLDHLDVLADGGDEDSATALAHWVAENRTARGAADLEPSPPWDGTPPDRRQRAYLDAALTRMADELACMRPDSGRNHALYIAAMKCGSFVAGAGMDEPTVVDRLTEAATRCGLTDEDGARSVAATIRSGLHNGRKNPRSVPEGKGRGAEGSGVRNRTPEPAVDRATGEPLRMLASLLASLRGWHHLPDPTHVVVALAAAATRDAEGEPCWVLLVAPPSSGKTEAVRLLDKAVDDRLDEVTPAGLLGWSKGKEARPTGVLARAGTRGLVTFGDLSTLLATSDRGGRDVVFALLRRAYDGYVSRDVSPPGRTEGTTKLEWSGRLTVVACVTGAIDRAAAHADQLGPRWLYVRLPERSTEAKREAARLARAGGLAERRKDAADTAADLLDLARRRVGNDLPREVDEVIEDAALVTAWGRAAVPRNGYGRRDIEGVPVIEEPMRLVQQLAAVARGMTGLGLPTEAVSATVRRVALDSMPEARRAVLTALSTGEVLTTSRVARAADLHRHVARFQLEELAAVGVVEHDRTDDEDDEPSGAVHWSLTGDDGALIAAVINAHERGGGWHETWVSPTPPPRNRDEDEDEDKEPSHTSCHPSCSTCGGPNTSTRAALPPADPTPVLSPVHTPPPQETGETGGTDETGTPCPLHPTSKPGVCWTCDENTRRAS